ncbi:MAG: DMT family transporter [Hyphomicrobiales bacterium]
MTGTHRDNRLLAIVCVLAAVGFAATQDAVVKAMSGSYSVYEAVMFRCIGSTPILAALLWKSGGFKSLATPLLRTVLLRSIILCSAYFAFVLSIAAMPIANTVAIYFTMPFFVAGLAGPLLGEHVRIHRWLAIVAGFIAVIIMVRPGAGVFEAAAFLALYSAFGYAWGQMIGRPLAQQVSPAVIANWQNLIYLAVSLILALFFNLFDFSGVSHKSLAFLMRPWVWPPAADAAVLFGIGILAAFGMVLFVSAYKYAESNFVAPFEYSSMIWAVGYGLILFGDFPDAFTWMGAAVVVAAGLTMIWRDRQLDRAAAQSP